MVAKIVYFGEAFPEIVNQAAPRAPELIARVLEEAGVDRTAAHVTVDYTRIAQLCRDANAAPCIIPAEIDELFATRFWGELRARPVSVERGVDGVGA